MDEEVSIAGLDRRSKIDILVLDNQTYRPVEAKLQKCSLKSFGKALEHIVTKMNRRAPVHANLNDGDTKRLGKPMLLLWWPPAAELFQPEGRSHLDRYKVIEVIQLGDALQALRTRMGDQADEAVASAIEDLVRTFLAGEDLRLTGHVKLRWQQFAASIEDDP